MFCLDAYRELCPKGPGHGRVGKDDGRDDPIIAGALEVQRPEVVVSVLPVVLLQT